MQLSHHFLISPPILFALSSVFLVKERSIALAVGGHSMLWIVPFFF
jgi:hypothetical protein